jgi:hypothetical protein
MMEFVLVFFHHSFEDVGELFTLFGEFDIHGLEFGECFGHGFPFGFIGFLLEFVVGGCVDYFEVETAVIFMHVGTVMDDCVVYTIWEYFILWLRVMFVWFGVGWVGFGVEGGWSEIFC